MIIIKVFSSELTQELSRRTARISAADRRDSSPSSAAPPPSTVPSAYTHRPADPRASIVQRLEIRAIPEKYYVVNFFRLRPQYTG